jgi:hypothetical protein
VRWAALAAATLAAAVLPGEPLGAAVPVVALLVLSTCLAAVRRDRFAAGCVVVSLALAAQASLLEAGWVVALDLTAAAGLAAVAVGGPYVVALARPLLELRDAPSLLPSQSRASLPYLRGAALASVVGLPFAILFLTGDAAFAAIARDIPAPDRWSLPGRAVTFALVLAAAVGLGLAARRPHAAWALRTRRRLSFAEWLIPLAVLDALFLAFVLVQITVLFGGHDRVLRTSGLTYAEYARSGFWQLLAAAGLTLAVIRASPLLAKPETRRERLLLHGLLATLGVLTLVVLASAWHRLHLYEEAFGLTRARLFAETSIVWLGALLVFVVAATLARRRPAAVAILGTGLALLAFSLSNPDRRVAERNVERWRDTGRLDIGYLDGLSADAVPSLVTLPADLRERATASHRERLARPEPWSSANRSRSEARRLLRG